jgi:uncharacterized membrane protein
MDWLGFVLRWFHIVAAITAVGGTIFMRFALVPSVSVLSEEQRKALHGQIRSRWAKLVMASIGFLLISGIVNFILFLKASKTWGIEWKNQYLILYHSVFLAKFLLALAVFFLASALAGRGEATKGFRENPKRWMTVNCVLALIIVALSGVLRLTHIGPTLPPSAAVPAVTSGDQNG